MLDWLDGENVWCGRCKQYPHLKDCLGCGEPPSRDDDLSEALWQSIDEDGVPISPFQAVQLGKPPYRRIGYGPIVKDWPWCPRWFAARLEGESWGSWTTVDGVPTLVFIREAYEFWKRGMLRDLIEPPWTKAFVDLLLFYDRLEQYDKEKLEQARAEMEAEKMQNMFSALAGR